RVLGHEINNSLAPIKSIAASLTGLLARDPRPADLDEDLTRGLDVIAARADALSRFMTAYARLARLPPPRPVPLSIGELIRRLARDAHPDRGRRRPGSHGARRRRPARAAPDQPGQERRGGDAGDGGRVWMWIRWDIGPTVQLEIHVEDDGPGLPETANLFVPL